MRSQTGRYVTLQQVSRYCIFRLGSDVMEFVKAAGDYSDHLLKSKYILAMLTNHSHFKEYPNFDHLNSDTIVPADFLFPEAP